MRRPFPGTMKIPGGSLTALIFNLNTFNWSAGLVTGMGLVPRVTQLQTSAANRLIGEVVQSHYHKGRAAIRHYANQPTRPIQLLRLRPNFMSTFARLA